MTPDAVGVAIVAGASRGIGAGNVAAYRRRGWAVVANARTEEPPRDRNILTVDGDVTEPATCDRIVDEALERFGRVDTLVNNAGVFLSKPFTDYTAQDYTRAVGVKPDGVLSSDPAGRRLHAAEAGRAHRHDHDDTR